MSSETTLEAPAIILAEIEVPAQVKPVSAPIEVTETPKTLEEYAKAISEMNRICEEADKQSKQLGQKSIEAAIKTGEWLIEVRPKIPHGEWEKWCKDRGVKKPIYLRRMKMAESKVTHGSLFKLCVSLRYAEICCGARSPEKQDKPPENKANGSADEEIKVIPELILNDVRNKFEYIQRQYDILTKLDPELNSFLLGKGYSNDFPLLLQQWQSSLSDVLAYFNLPPVAPDVCVRCGHVREWDELFVPISAYHPLQHLQKFNLWCQQCEAAYDYDFEKKTFTQKHVFENLPKAIKVLKENLDELKLLKVKEFTLRQKWYQLTYDKNIATPKQISEMESQIWTPTDINNEELTIQEIQAIQPKLVVVQPKDKKADEEWNIFKHFISTAVNNDIPARYIKFLVRDASKNNSVIGIGSIASDFMALGVRDKFIGWTPEQKMRGKLKHTAVASTVVATQPFGFNFNGAKLIAALVTSQTIRDAWKERYGETLVGMTTTSLYGYEKNGSFYNSIREWKPLGLSTGRVPIQPKLELWYKWKQFLRETRTYEFGEVLIKKDNKGPVTNQKAKEITMMFKAAGLKLGNYIQKHKRGVYFSEFYENTKDFLCGKISEGELKMKPLFQETVQQITDRWKQKARKRYKEQKQKGKLKPEKQSFGQLGKMDFKTAKETYLDVDEASDDVTVGDVEG